MSWISDLAGKAETLLNKIDQNAASVLQQQQQQQQQQSAGLLQLPVDSSENKTTPAKMKSMPKFQVSPMKLQRKLESNDLQKIPSNSDLEQNDSTSISNISSRRSSVNSKFDLNSDEKDAEISSNKTVNSTNSLNTNQELAAFKIALAEIKSERDELKEEVSNLQTELNNISNETLIQELKLDIENVSQERDELNTKILEFTKINNISKKTISELELKLSSVTNNFIDLNEKYQWQIKEINMKQTDLEEYRKKAQTTLQQKEKLIEELRNKKTSEHNFPQAEDINKNNEFNQCQYENLKDEILLKANENHQLQMELEEIKIISENNKFKLNQLQNEYDSQINLMKNNLNIEINKSEELESEVKILNQEIVAIRQEFNKQNQSLLNQLHGKEQELNKEKLKHEKRMQSNIGDGNNFQIRMQTLTQALVEKQSTIEAITAEKNAMKLQVENVQEQLKHVIIQNRPQRNQIINVNDTDDAKASLPIIMRENPFDTGVTRRVKRAYSSLDYLGYRIGIFLKRFPLARVLIIIYIAFLHLFVMFVLLSSTPT